MYTQWYGPTAFGRLAVTQQPAFSSGQSWPTLIYLPISAFFDPTTLWQLLGRNTFHFSKEFANVVTAHEVAHQWWGHTVGQASYHDRWLSEGFADFSAGLFLEATQPNTDESQKFWDSERRLLLEKNQYGFRANDAGPLWMGERLSSFRAASADRRITYAKGAFVLHMLRYLMQDRQTGDQAFIAMMHDFLTTYHGKCASTEDFQRMAEKHMRPDMDLEHNGHLNWFFFEWVYSDRCAQLPPGLHAGRRGRRQDPAHDEDHAGRRRPFVQNARAGVPGLRRQASQAGNGARDRDLPPATS